MIKENKLFKYLVYALGEILLVVIGILIALWINNWNQNKKDQKYLDQIFTAINQELTETHKDIVDKMVIQNKFIDSLDVYLENDQIELINLIVRIDGIHAPTIRTNSWKVISNSKIELVDYHTISTFTNIEQEKEMFNMKMNKIMDYIYENALEKGKEKKQFMKLLMKDLIVTELGLQEEIERIINN